MSFAFVQRATFLRTRWGQTKLALWDFWTAWMAWFCIEVGDIPKSWSKGT